MPPVNALKKEVYFNEWEPYPANWLRNLYPSAVVDVIDIKDVRVESLRGFNRCHFFSGIGGWEQALRLAGWNFQNRVWTASLPCQLFSSPGKQKGILDERHLWPVFFPLVRKLRHPTLFGEQVASPLGFEWLDGVRHELEAEDYAFGTACLPAGAVGSPHRRYRIFWVAHANGQRLQRRGLRLGQDRRQRGPWSSGFDVLHLTDRTKRRTQSGVLPLAHGIPGRVEQIKAYGNAIVPQVAAMFIEAFMDVKETECLL